MRIVDCESGFKSAVGFIKGNDEKFEIVIAESRIRRRRSLMSVSHIFFLLFLVIFCNEDFMK